MKTKASNEIDRYVGNRLKARRESLGISQERLAAALGVTFQQVQKYEKGINRVSASRLQAAADVLQVTIAYFFEGTSGQKSRADDPSSTYITKFLASEDGRALVRAFTRIPQAKIRHLIVNLVGELAEAEK